MKKAACLLLCASLAAVSLAGMVPADVTALSGGINDFTFDLYHRLAGDPAENIFCSPFSVSTALGMTFGGAREETARQMASTLHYGSARDKLHPAFRDLMRAIKDTQKEDAIDIAIANRLWVQKTFKLLESYEKLVQQNYGAGLAQVDFETDAEGVRREINQWVEQQTRDRIRDLIAPGMLDRDTRMVLVNAIYFFGFWADAFDPKLTRERPFYRAGMEPVDVQLMVRSGDYAYREDEKFQLLALPYKGGDLSMIVILPREGVDIREVEAGLTAELVNRQLAEAIRRKVNVWLPRFRIEASFSLARVLAAMGMPEAFTGLADFSGMTGNKDLIIGYVIHKAFVDVTEKGTEAAAATAVMMKPASAQPMDLPVEFRADRPFVFLIRDSQTGTILFIGRLADPN